MVLYHCDSRDCKFTTSDKNELTHIIIGDPTKSALSAELAEKDFCPNCIKRFTESILSQTVGHSEPKEKQRKPLNDFEVGIATFAASCAEKWQRICYAGNSNKVAKAYLESIYGNQSDTYLLRKYNLIPPKVWSALSSDVQYACKQIVAELLNIYDKTKSIPAAARYYDVQPMTVSGIISSNIVVNFSKGELLCDMPVPSVKRMVLALTERNYTVNDNEVIAKKYNVSENDFIHPTYAVMQKCVDLVKKIEASYLEDKSVTDIAIMYSCPVYLVKDILKAKVCSDRWHDDLLE